MLLELIIEKPGFTIDDVKDCMYRNLKSLPEELRTALDGYITSTQRKFFAHVVNVILTPTALIETTDSLIKSTLTEDEINAITALDQIHGIGVVSAE